MNNEEIVADNTHACKFENTMSRIESAVKPIEDNYLSKDIQIRREYDAAKKKLKKRFDKHRAANEQELKDKINAVPDIALFKKYYYWYGEHDKPFARNFDTIREGSVYNICYKHMDKSFIRGLKLTPGELEFVSDYAKECLKRTKIHHTLLQRFTDIAIGKYPKYIKIVPDPIVQDSPDVFRRTYPM